MDNEILQVVMRYVHICSAVIAMGGMTFLIACLLPAANKLPEAERGLVVSSAIERFHRWVWIAIVGLTVSGAYAWYLNNAIYSAIKPWGQMLIGTKVLVALIMFGLVAAKSMGLIKFSKPRVLPMINLHLAAIVVLLAAILRAFRLHHMAGG